MPSGLTDDYTYRFTDTGVILNSTASIPFVDVTEVDGLDTAPIRVSQRSRDGMHGGFTDATWEDQRALLVTGTAYADAASAESYLQTLKLNYAANPNPQPFYFRHPGVGNRVVYAKSLGIKSNVDQLRRVGSAAMIISLAVEDPRIYDETIQVETTGISTITSGRGYNKSFNYGYGSGTPSGSCTCNNAGNRDTGAIITLQSVHNPRIYTDDGDALVFNGLDASGSDVITIDLLNRQVQLNGVNRRGTLDDSQSNWFLLEPGNTVFKLIASPMLGTPTMTVTFQSAYY